MATKLNLRHGQFSLCLLSDETENDSVVISDKHHTVLMEPSGVRVLDPDKHRGFRNTLKEFEDYEDSQDMLIASLPALPFPVTMELFRKPKNVGQ